MSTAHNVKIEFTSEQKATIETAFKTLKDTLSPVLVSLTPDEKKSMLILGDKSFSFVNRSLMFATQNPEFSPTYLNQNEWKIDWESWKELAPINAQLIELNSLLNDTIAVCGNEAFRQALTYYNNVKQAAKDNVPSAKPIYEELKQQFPNHKKNKAVVE
jgi:hypothetical protein